MEKQLLLSIVVPVYNAVKYLQRTIDSLLCQDLDERDYEIILVNDGSTDNSLLLIKENMICHTNIILIDKKNKGVSSARNAGIEKARGKYIMQVDADDFLEPKIIGKLVKLAEEKQVELLFYRAKFYPDRHEVTNIQPFEIGKVYNGEYVLLHGMHVSSPWSNLYLRKFVLQVGLKYFDGISHQDVEYNYRLYPHARRIVFSDIVAYHYNVCGESVTRTSDPLKLQKLMLDNIDVAANVIRYYKTSMFSQELKNLIIRRMNSVVVSMLFLFFRNKETDIFFIRKFLAYAYQRKVYPVRGKTLSWKTTVLIPLLNRKKLYLFLCKLFKR